MTGVDDRQIDREFRAWCESGDVDALGRVFDATASTLLLTALRLGFDDSSARDLVQRTFLVAIEEPRRWDPERPARPWLAGVLALEARRLRRDLGRSPDPAGLSTERPAADPADQASHRELGKQAEVVIAELPSEQRTVLVLRLLHGLEPVEIARALELPAATVRTRLHRGLRALRARLGVTASALAGLAWSGEPALDDQRLLLGLREQVLSQAAAPRAAAMVGSKVSAGGVGSSLAAAAALWISVAVLAVLLVCGLGAVSSSGAGVGSPRDAAALGSVVATASRASGGLVASTPSAGGGPAETTRIEVASEPATQPGSSVRVRVLDAAGSPAVGVVVVRIFRLGGDLPSSTMSRQLTDDRGEVAVSLTDDDGRPPSPETECYVTVIEPGLELPRQQVDLLDPPERLADFRLAPTGSLEVRLVDPTGQPVERPGSMLALLVQDEQRQMRGVLSHARPVESEVSSGVEELVHGHGAVRVVDGRIVWPHCKPGLRVRFELGNARWNLDTADGSWFDGPLEAGQRARVTLRMRPAVRLLGRYAWRGAEPLPPDRQLMARVLVGGAWKWVGCLPRGADGFVLLLPPDVRSEQVVGVGLRIALRSAGESLRAERSLRIAAGPGPHDVGTLVVERPSRLASGRIVDSDGAMMPLRSLGLEVSAADPADLSWSGSVRALEEGRFEVRGPADPRLRRLRITGEHVFELDGAMAQLEAPLEFAPGAHALELRLRRFARLEVGCVDGSGLPCRPILRLVDDRGRVRYPNVAGQIRDGVAVHSIVQIPFGVWRLEVLLPGTDHPLHSVDGIELRSPELHRPPRLQRIVLDALTSLALRVVGDDGLPLDVLEGRYYLRDPRDPALWHGRLTLGRTVHVPVRRSTRPDVVLRFDGYRPILLRRVAESQDLHLAPLDPDAEAPASRGTPQRYLIRQPQLDFTDELAGQPFPAAWWTPRGR